MAGFDSHYPPFEQQLPNLGLCWVTSEFLVESTRKPEALIRVRCLDQSHFSKSLKAGVRQHSKIVDHYLDLWMTWPQALQAVLQPEQAL